MSCQRVLPDALLPEETVQGSFHLHLDPVPRLVADARAFVLEHAPEMTADGRDALALLTSELVTNAVLHARTAIELGITLSDESVLVTVHDLDLARPEQDPYGPREGGWGLGLVAALADASSLEPHPDGGKTAWFRISRRTDVDVPDAAAARTADDGGAP